MFGSYKFRLEYLENGKKKSIVGKETELYFLKEIANDSNIEIAIIPKKPIEMLRAYVDLDYDFKPNDKVYVNGYQSWTVSREYTKDDIQPGIMDKFGKYKAKELYHMMGDYDFQNYSKQKGGFHSFSYTYIKSNGVYVLLGSLTEKYGYTIFEYDMKKNRLSIAKDVEAVTITDRYQLFSVCKFSGNYNEVFDAYFARIGIPKPRFGRMKGYTSWYNYYGEISEEILVRDLESLSAIGDKADIFQIDDGYQTAVGEWTTIKTERFPSGMKSLVDKIHDKGYKAGIWLAPFNVQKNSQIVKEHPEWLIKTAKGKFDDGVPCWGGAYTFDIYVPEAREYIKNCFNVILNEWGFDMVKLDFLYSECHLPRCGKSRGQIMTEAMEFLRECVGDKIILGCGVPLFPAFGLVDFCRISADVGTSFVTSEEVKHSTQEVPCTKSAMNNTIFRRHLDKRAFINDPDVFYIRENEITSKDEYALPCSKLEFTDSQKELVVRINSMLGNVLFVSDNIGGYNEKQLNRLLKAFAKPKETVLDAEYINKDEIKIIYETDGIKWQLLFNTTNGDYTDTQM